MLQVQYGEAEQEGQPAGQLLDLVVRQIQHLQSGEGLKSGGKGSKDGKKTGERGPIAGAMGSQAHAWAGRSVWRVLCLGELWVA